LGGLVIAVAAGCGSRNNAVNNPFRDFQIDDELTHAVYTYQFPDSAVDMEYFADKGEGLGISTANDHSVTVGFHRPKEDSSDFSGTTAEMDTNNNGNFFDDTAIPASGSGSFSDTGDKLTLNVSIVGIINFNSTGDLISTRPIGG